MLLFLIKRQVYNTKTSEIWQVKAFWTESRHVSCKNNLFYTNLAAALPVSYNFTAFCTNHTSVSWQNLLVKIYFRTKIILFARIWRPLPLFRTISLHFARTRLSVFWQNLHVKICFRAKIIFFARIWRPLPLFRTISLRFARTRMQIYSIVLRPKRSRGHFTTNK